MTPSDLADRIILLRKRGHSIGTISRSLGVAKTTVWDICHRDDKVSKRAPAKPYSAIPAASDAAVQVSTKENAEAMVKPILAYIRKAKHGTTVEAMANQFNCAPRTIREVLQALSTNGHNIELINGGVELSGQIRPSKPSTIDISKFTARTIKFGLTADNHLGSKYCRNDVLNALFDIWESQGVDTVYQLGNMIDGDARFNRFDLLAHGMEEQVNFFVKHWPKRDGIVTKFITGDDHEGWYCQREGVDIGRVIEGYARQEKREDLVYLGHMEHDIVFQAPQGSAIMRLIHAGGGSAYATSYSAQKIVESYQGGEKPAILLIGHYHKAEYGYPREVHCVQGGCTEDQTPFMRKLKIQAHVGGWTISFNLDDAGIVHGFTPQWHPFYDRAFYEDGQSQWGFKFDKMKKRKPTLIEV